MNRNKIKYKKSGRIGKSVKKDDFSSIFKVKVHR